MAKKSIKSLGWVYESENLGEILGWAVAHVKDNILYGLKSSVEDSQGNQVKAKRVEIRITVTDITPKIKKSPVGRPSLKRLAQQRRRDLREIKIIEDALIEAEALNL